MDSGRSRLRKQNKTFDCSWVVDFFFFFFCRLRIHAEASEPGGRRGRVKGYDPGGEDPGGGRGISLKRFYLLLGDEICNFKLNFDD